MDKYNLIYYSFVGIGGTEVYLSLSRFPLLKLIIIIYFFRSRSMILEVDRIQRSIIFPRGGRESVLYSRLNLVSGHVRRDSRGLYRHRGIEFIRESA